MPTQTAARRKEKSGTEWRVLLPEKMIEQARTIADEVANRLIDTDLLVQNLRALQSQGSAEFPVGWDPYGLMQGFGGLGMMCNHFEYCCPDEDWGKVGAEFLKIATEQYFEFFEDQPEPDTSLCSGCTGLALSALQAPTSRARHKRVMKDFGNLLEQAITRRIAQIREDRGIRVGSYDTLYGVSGIGRYLLSRLPDKQSQSGLHCILEALIERSAEVDGLLAYYTPYELLTEFERKRIKSGYINCGLAHGVPGPLTLMALALKRHVKLPRLRESVEMLAEWLVGELMEDEWGINWPASVSVKDTESELEGQSGSRAAWCYGTPGVARSLWLAGDCLDSTKYKEIAVKAMAAMYKRPVDVQSIVAPTLCHGVAGVLCSTVRFAMDTGDALFVEAAANLTQQIIDYYDPTTFWGFQERFPDGRKIDNPGLLNGASGVVLGLLSVAYPIEPKWDQVLLLS